MNARCLRNAGNASDDLNRLFLILDSSGLRRNLLYVGISGYIARVMKRKVLRRYERGSSVERTIANVTAILSCTDLVNIPGNYQQSVHHRKSTS